MSIIFSGSELLEVALGIERNRVSSQVEALDIGIQAEKDSILFYTEMQNLVKPADHQVILTIINQERDHLNQLSQLKKTILKAG